MANTDVSKVLRQQAKRVANEKRIRGLEQKHSTRFDQWKATCLKLEKTARDYHNNRKSRPFASAILKAANSIKKLGLSEQLRENRDRIMEALKADPTGKFLFPNEDVQIVSDGLRIKELLIVALDSGDVAVVESAVNGDIGKFELTPHWAVNSLMQDVWLLESLPDPFNNFKPKNANEIRDELRCIAELSDAVRLGLTDDAKRQANRLLHPFSNPTPGRLSKWFTWEVKSGNGGRSELATSLKKLLGLLGLIAGQKVSNCKNNDPTATAEQLRNLAKRIEPRLLAIVPQGPTPQSPRPEQLAAPSIGKPDAKVRSNAGRKPIKKMTKLEKQIWIAWNTRSYSEYRLCDKALKITPGTTKSTIAKLKRRKKAN